MNASPLPIVAACAALESAVNAALSLDHGSQNQLAQLAPGIVSISCEQPAFTIFLRLGDTVEVMSHFDGEADAGISGDATAWLQLVGADDKAAALVNSDLSITGDSQLFVALGKIAEQVDVDWEGELAKFIGDVPAHLIGKASRKVQGARKQLRATLGRTVDDLLHEELRLLPKRIEVDNFYAELRKCEMRLERAAARLQRLKHK